MIAVCCDHGGLSLKHLGSGEKRAVKKRAQASRRTGIIDRGADDEPVALLHLSGEFRVQLFFENASVSGCAAFPAGDTSLYWTATDVKEL